MSLDMQQEYKHGSAVAVDGRGLLIIGPAGSGKSSLAAGLISRGAGLIADDQVVLNRKGAQVWMSAPDTIAGLIETRGIGVLRCPVHPPVPLFAVVDLTREEPDRLPPMRMITVMGCDFPLILGGGRGIGEAGLFLYLLHGRHA